MTNGTNITTTEYLDGFQYKNQDLQFFPTAEGYVRVTGSPTKTKHWYDYVYNYTDHLGNIRFSYTQNPSTGGISKVEENHYYPFGLEHGKYNSGKKDYKAVSDNARSLLPVVYIQPYKYKYNGKEYQDELGLNVYDYGWRQYDAALGRFNKMDRFSEKYYSKSPYNYTANNPVRFIDVKGDSIIVGGSCSSISTFKQIVRNGLGNNYNVDVDGRGHVSIKAKNSKSESKLTTRQLRFKSVLDESISHSSDISFNLVDHNDESSKDFVVGDNGASTVSSNPGFHTLDVDDISKFGTEGKLTSSGALGHEVKEGFELQKSGLGVPINDYRASLAAHKLGYTEERHINGLTGMRSPTGTPDGNTSVEVRLNNVNSTVIIKSENNNVTSLENNSR